MRPIGVFGGTFDPIHYGHLRSAFEMLQALDFDQVRFIPCGDPPHRGVTVASAKRRMRLVELIGAGAHVRGNRSKCLVRGRIRGLVEFGIGRCERANR